MSRIRAKSGAVSAAWALTGTGLILAFAVVRLTGRGLQTIQAGLEVGEWLALALLTALFVYGEGVLALQRRWIPRVIARARRLSGEGSPLVRILAPFYAMGVLGGPRPELIRAWAGAGAIVLAVLAIRSFPPPWRGITALAVAGALAWGVGALAWKAPGAFATPSPGPLRDDLYPDA